MFDATFNRCACVGANPTFPTNFIPKGEFNKMFKSASSIQKIKNSEVKFWFTEMLHYMIEKLNDEVNIYRDKILHYAISIRNKAIEEFKTIDNVMYLFFSEYASYTYGKI